MPFQSTKSITGYYLGDTVLTSGKLIFYRPRLVVSLLSNKYFFSGLSMGKVILSVTLFRRNGKHILIHPT
jgi:hypothetical protein